MFIVQLLYTHERHALIVSAWLYVQYMHSGCRWYLRCRPHNFLQGAFPRCSRNARAQRYTPKIIASCNEEHDFKQLITLKVALC